MAKCVYVIARNVLNAAFLISSPSLDVAGKHAKRHARRALNGKLILIG